MKPKKKVKPAPKNATAAWKALTSCSDLFRELWLTQRMRKPLHMSREHRGYANGSTPSQIDYLVDYELTIRACYPDPGKRKKFWAWLWSPAIYNSESNAVYRKGQENFAQRVGTELMARGLYPIGGVGGYFTPICRVDSKDHSKIIIDRPRMLSVVAKYESLRKSWEEKYGRTPVANAPEDIETPETPEQECTPDTPEQVEPDCLALDGVHEFASQHEGYDYSEGTS